MMPQVGKDAPGCGGNELPAEEFAALKAALDVLDPEGLGVISARQLEESHIDIHNIHYPMWKFEDVVRANRDAPTQESAAHSPKGKTFFQTHSKWQNTKKKLLALSAFKHIGETPKYTPVSATETIPIHTLMASIYPHLNPEYLYRLFTPTLTREDIHYFWFSWYVHCKSGYLSTHYLKTTDFVFDSMQISRSAFSDVDPRLDCVQTLQTVFASIPAPLLQKYMQTEFTDVDYRYIRYMYDVLDDRRTGSLLYNRFRRFDNLYVYDMPVDARLFNRLDFKKSRRLNFLDFVAGFFPLVPEWKLAEQLQEYSTRSHSGCPLAMDPVPVLQLDRATYEQFMADIAPMKENSLPEAPIFYKNFFEDHTTITIRSRELDCSWFLALDPKDTGTVRIEIVAKALFPHIPPREVERWFVTFLTTEEVLSAFLAFRSMAHCDLLSLGVLKQAHNQVNGLVIDYETVRQEGQAHLDFATTLHLMYPMLPAATAERYAITDLTKSLFKRLAHLYMNWKKEERGITRAYLMELRQARLSDPDGPISITPLVSYPSPTARETSGSDPPTPARSESSFGKALEPESNQEARPGSSRHRPASAASSRHTDTAITSPTSAPTSRASRHSSMSSTGTYTLTRFLTLELDEAFFISALCYTRITIVELIKVYLPLVSMARIVQAMNDYSVEFLPLNLPNQTNVLKALVEKESRLRWDLEQERAQEVRALNPNPNSHTTQRTLALDIEGQEARARIELRTHESKVRRWLAEMEWKYRGTSLKLDIDVAHKKAHNSLFNEIKIISAGVTQQEKFARQRIVAQFKESNSRIEIHAIESIHADKLWNHHPLGRQKRLLETCALEAKARNSILITEIFDRDLVHSMMSQRAQTRSNRSEWWQDRGAKAYEKFTQYAASSILEQEKNSAERKTIEFLERRRCLLPFLK